MKYLQYIKAIVLFFFVALRCDFAAASSGDGECFGLKIGVYYYPGWGLDSIFVQKDPWGNIRRYKNIEPLKGYYWDGSAGTVSQQIDEMVSAGFSYVVYDWYWTSGRGVGLDNSITTFRRVNARRSSPLKYFIMWANRSGSPVSEKDFDNMIEYMLNSYFLDKFYERIDGRPVVMIYDYGGFIKDVARFGGVAPVLLNRAHKHAISKGFGGIYFIAGGIYEYILNGGVDVRGIDAVSDYNYHNTRPDDSGRRRLSYSYEELTDGYLSNWNYVVSKNFLPYWIPVTSGWDRRPWGGSSDPRHDNSAGNPDLYYEHLKNAAEFSRDSVIDSGGRRATVCCWNEYGEGSIVEPTIGYGRGFLSSTSRVISDCARSTSR